MSLGVCWALASAALAAPPGFAPLPTSGAATRYVAPSGSDGNPGTRARPWRTLDHAAERVGAGQTIMLRRGTYAGNATIGASGRAGAPITLRSAPGEAAVIAGQLTVTGSWVRVSRLRFSAGGSSGDVQLYISGADHVEVSGNNFRGSPMSAIFVGDGEDVSHDVRILGNRVSENGDDSQFHHGIYCGHADGAVIANNVVDHNAAFGIQAYPDCDNANIANNTIVGNGQAGIVVGGDGDTTSQGVRVVNNIIFGNGTSGVQTVWEGSTGSGTVVRNLISGNRSGPFATEGLTRDTNLFFSPGFTSLTRRDYRPRAGSAAIGRAVVAYSPTRDLAGRARGGRRDLGALERIVGR